MSEYVWLTEFSQQFLERDYLLAGQSVDNRVDVICNAAEIILKKLGFAERFKENIKKGWYSLSTPIWANFGTDRGLPISCFGSQINDSMDSILRTHAEVGMMTKHGGGTSAYFGRLRERSAKIKDNGESSGSVHFMQLFDNLIKIISQGSTRRGQFAAYLPIDHPDINEFLTIRSEGSPLQDISFGVCVPDYWMQEMIDGDAAKRKVWAKVLGCRANTGYPYILFTDTVNNNSVDVYKDKGMKITHSNLCCVVGDQRVVSDRGLLTAKELYDLGGKLTLFDGDKAVEASEMRLISEKEKVFKVTLENGMTHTVTSDHKIQTARGMVEVHDLHVGDEVLVQTKKGLYGPDSDVPSEVNTWASGPIPSWVWSCNEDAQWKYLFDWKNKEIHIKSRSRELLSDLQILLSNLGKNTTLETSDDPSWYSLRDLHDAKATSPVVSVEYVGEEPVYCCEVFTSDHKWVCNGFQTHNSEILLPDNEEESFVCDLSSMNILRYDEWKDTDAVELLVYFLDAVMTEFIEKARPIKFMERAVRFAERHRALGIGWIGWHSYLQSKMIPFEGFEAQGHNIAIAKNVKTAAYAASEKLATEYGEPEVLMGYGRRNTTLLAIAPTKSSAFIMGQASEGIEPHRTNYYIKDLQKGKFTIKNLQLQELLAQKGLDTDEVWDEILKHGGSVQQLSGLTDYEKEVFKTFAEISQREIVVQAAQRQNYIDQSQSLNLMIHPSIPIKDVNALLIEAWRLGVRSLYYQVSVNAAQQFSRNILTCAGCEG